MVAMLPIGGYHKGDGKGFWGGGGSRLGGGWIVGEGNDRKERRAW